MAHWGWYWKVKLKHHPKDICSALTSIDSFEIFKNNTNPSFKIPNYQLTALPSNNYFSVVYGKNKEQSYVIPFEKQSCNYGGFRHYFHCPLCQKRMRKLYFTHGVFLCRKCLNLGYYSQRLVASTRNMLLASKIEKILEAKGGSLQEKPKWMKQVTFKALQIRYAKYRKKGDDATQKELFAWYPKKQAHIEALL